MIVSVPRLFPVFPMLLRRVAQISFDIRVFGSLQIWQAGDRAVAIKNKKGRALIAYLAMQRDYCASREHLSVLLWGDNADANARHSLRQCLVCLRADLADLWPSLVHTDTNIVGLVSDNISVDARRLLDWRPNDADLEEILSSAQADFLADTVLNDSFDSWLSEQRTLLADRLAGLVAHVASKSENLRLAPAALRAAEKLATIDPLREDWQRSLIALTAMVHGRSAALARYKLCEAQLKSELGVDPEEETAALIARISSTDHTSGREPTLAPHQSAMALPEKPARHDDAKKGTTRRWISRCTARQPLGARMAGWRRTFAPGATGRTAAVALAVLAAGSAGWATATFSNARPSSEPARQYLSNARGNDLAGTLRVTIAAIRPIEPAPQGEISLDQIREGIAEHVGRLAIADVAVSEDVATTGATGYTIKGALFSEQGINRLRLELLGPDAIRRWHGTFSIDATDPVGASVLRRIGREVELALIKAEARDAHTQRRPSKENLLFAARAAHTRGFASRDTLGMFERALQLDSNSPQAMVGIAAQLIQLQSQELRHDPAELRRAKNHLIRALRIDPSMALAHFFLGMLHKANGNSVAALQRFKRTLELNPSFVPAYANIGHALMLEGRLEEALENVRLAKRLSPNDAFFPTWSVIEGEIQFERGEFAAAIACFQVALARSPGLARAYGWIAAAHRSVGDDASAAQYMREFQSLLGPVNPEALLDRLRYAPEGGLERSRPKLFEALLSVAAKS